MLSGPFRQRLSTQWRSYSSSSSSSSSNLRETIQRYRPPPLLPLAIRIGQVVAAYHFITTTIVDIRLCSGHSMLPTLSYEGDCVVCSPIPYWFPFISPAKRRPKRGDLVVADSPNSLGSTVLKRVIGVEGDVIEIEPRRGVDRKWVAEADEAYFGDRPLHPGLEHRGKDSEGRPIAHGRRGEGRFVKVPKGYIWVVGDNLSNSTDSRHYGPVPLAMVKGKVLARIWPNPTSFVNPVKLTNKETTPPEPISNIIIAPTLLQNIMHRAIAWTPKEQLLPPIPVNVKALLSSLTPL